MHNRSVGLPPAPPIRIILIEPEQPGNLGAVARAMGNMGFAEITLVRPRADRTHREAQAMSLSAYPILKEATVTETLTAATQGCHVAIGFTRRQGRQRRQFLEIKELTPFVRERIAKGEKMGLIFGPESRGFTTNEANACQWLVRLPSTDEHPSLNLAQAVLVTCYELQREQWEFTKLQRSRTATIGDLEGMYGHLEEVLTAVRFNDEQNPARIPRILRRLFNRAQPTKQEVRIVRGLCRNALYRLKNH